MPVPPLSVSAIAQLAPPGAAAPTVRFPEFAVAISYDAGQAVLSVRGEVDLVTAPALGAALGVLVDQGHPDVVLDLIDLTFMDASGLRALADASVQLAASDRVLTVRSAPALIRRILEVSGVAELVEIEAQAPHGPALGPEQREGDRSHVVAGPQADLTSDLAHVRSMHARDVVVDAALRLVTALTSASVLGADGASVSLERHGRLRTVASSDDTVLRMDHHQYETGEGPCVAAATEGHRFYSESLAEEHRWPAFVPKAIDEGIASILSTPLLAGGRPLGALNIYSNVNRAFGPAQQELAALFATQASGILADAGVDASDDQVRWRILDALVARDLIAKAQGVIMARRSLGADAAAATLHRWARASKVPVQTEAASVVASTRLDGGSEPEGVDRG